jgi:hypothetical protein
MNAIVSYTKDAPILKIVLGVVVFFGGLFIFIFGAILFGLMFMVIGVNLCLLEGSEIDLNNKLYRTTKSIFGVKLGKWKPIPNFEYISVFKTSETQQVNVVSASAKFNSSVIVLNLFYDRNKHITFYKTENKEDAFAVANHFKLALDIDILDATESEKKWL